jgi:zinc protease
VPLVAVRLQINGGHRMDVHTPDKSGLAVLTASMMNEATENFTAEQVQEELRKLGSSINVYADDNKTVLTVNSLKRNLAKTMEIAEEVLYRPKFSQEDFDRLKKKQLEDVRSNMKDPAVIAQSVYRRMLYGDDHIYAVRSYGIEASVEKISLDDVKTFYNKYYAPEVTELVVVGAVSQKEIMPSLEFLKKWKNKGVEIPELAPVRDQEKTRIYLVDKKEAPQSEIRIGYVTDMPYDATGDYFKSYLMNYALGGAFNSRINLNLREDKGWTYGAWSLFDSDDDPGPYTAEGGIRADATAGAVYEFMKEITNYKNNGITDDELTFMRNSVGQRDARSYETPDQKATFLSRIVHYDLDRSYVDEQTRIIKTITKEEINALADKKLQVDKMNIVVVGDKASNIEKLNELGYEIIELNEKGEVIDSKNKEIKE